MADGRATGQQHDRGRGGQQGAADRVTPADRRRHRRCGGRRTDAWPAARGDRRSGGEPRELDGPGLLDLGRHHVQGGRQRLRLILGRSGRRTAGLVARHPQRRQRDQGDLDVGRGVLAGRAGLQVRHDPLLLGRVQPAGQRLRQQQSLGTGVPAHFFSPSSVRARRRARRP